MINAEHVESKRLQEHEICNAYSVRVSDCHMRREIFNDSIDDISKYLERINNRFSFDDPRFVDRYIESELLIGVAFIVNATGEKFEAWFQREPIVCRMDEHSHGSDDFCCSFGRRGVDACHIPGSDFRDIEPARFRPDGKKVSMLLNVVESTERPEGVIPSLVWFQRSDGVNTFLPRARYFALNRGLIYFGPENREVDNAGVGRVATQAGSNDLECQIVKGAPQVVNGVASDQGDIDGDGAHFRNIIDWASCFRIHLASNCIRPGFKEAGDLPIQVVDVLFGPVYF